MFVLKLLGFVAFLENEVDVGADSIVVKVRDSQGI